MVFTLGNPLNPTNHTYGENTNEDELCQKIYNNLSKINCIYFYGVSNPRSKIILKKCVGLRDIIKFDLPNKPTDYDMKELIKLVYDKIRNNICGSNVIVYISSGEYYNIINKYFTNIFTVKFLV
jgi:hypothetical protein